MSPYLHSWLNIKYDGGIIKILLLLLSLNLFAESINFTEKEQAWIDKKNVIRVSYSPFWLPFEFIDDEGKMQGIAKDYLDIISKKSGLIFKPVKSESWDEAVKKTKNKERDMYSAVFENSERRKYMKFSVPYIKVPIVIVNKIKIPFIENIRSFKEKRIAIVKNGPFEGFLRATYPSIIIVEKKNIKDVFKAVLSGKADGALTNLATAGYLINKSFYGELKIATKTKLEFDIKMAVRKDWPPEVISIINKSLNSIPLSLKKKLYNKWFTLKVEEKIDYRIIIEVTFFFVILIIGFFLRNRKLHTYNKKIKKAKNKAEEATKVKSEFLANMSHEIRTPMNAIIGFTELLEQTSLNDLQKSYLESIKASGKGLLTIINDIIDLSKIEAGKFSLEYETIQMDKFLNDIKMIFSDKITKKGLEFNIKIDESFSPYLILDPTRLRQIIFNLIGNAIKFTDTGYINLIVKHEKDKNNKINFILVIEDSGIGIAKEQINSIFNKFEQSKNQSNKKYGGSGLGLAVSLKLAKMMNGNINLESEEGKGSKFTLIVYDIKVENDNKLYFDKLSNRKEEIKKMEIKEKNTEKSISKNKFKLKNQEELINILENELLNDYEKANEGVFEDILIFCDKLLKIAEKYKFKELKNYADNLRNFVDLFDIENIELKLKEYKMIIKELKNE